MWLSYRTWPLLLICVSNSLESVRDFTNFGGHYNKPQLPKAGAVDKTSRLWRAVLAMTRDDPDVIDDI